MAKKTETFEISLQPDEWKKHKKLIGISNCKCYKDPSEIFLLGLQTACNSHHIK